jgi:hypothetical protein
MIMPLDVYRHRAALIAEYGFAPNAVAADGVSADGFRVVGEFPDLGTPRYVVGEVPTTFIRWKPEDAQRAAEAIRLDWEETIGPEGVEQMRAMVKP